MTNVNSFFTVFSGNISQMAISSYSRRYIRVKRSIARLKKRYEPQLPDNHLYSLFRRLEHALWCELQGSFDKAVRPLVLDGISIVTLTGYLRELIRIRDPLHIWSGKKRYDSSVQLDIRLQGDCVVQAFVQGSSLEQIFVDEQYIDLDYRKNSADDGASPDHLPVARQHNIPVAENVTSLTTVSLGEMMEGFVAALPCALGEGAIKLPSTLSVEELAESMSFSCRTIDERATYLHKMARGALDFGCDSPASCCAHAEEILLLDGFSKLSDSLLGTRNPENDEARQLALCLLWFYESTKGLRPDRAKEALETIKAAQERRIATCESLRMPSEVLGKEKARAALTSNNLRIFNLNYSWLCSALRG